MIYFYATGKITFPKEHVLHNFTKHFSGARKSLVNKCLNGKYVRNDAHKTFA